MVIHCFAFIWQAEVTPEQKSKAVEAIRGLQGRIPGLLATYVGENVSPRSRGYELGGVMHFEDHAALERYNDHPVHAELVGWLRPMIEAVEIDFDPAR